LGDQPRYLHRVFPHHLNATYLQHQFLRLSYQPDPLRQFLETYNCRRLTASSPGASLANVSSSEVKERKARV
jgi:hypothetical protein